jgi:fluoroacetyl-CoA thioesterase
LPKGKKRSEGEFHLTDIMRQSQIIFGKDGGDGIERRKKRRQPGARMDSRGAVAVDLNLSVGMTGEKREVVTGDNTAIKHGSGNLAVYATPAMIGLMEGAAVNAIAAHLPDGASSVGIDLKVKHTAATPVGMAVRATAELIQIDGRRLVFSVKAFDEKEQIGSGTHERFVIDIKKFLQKAEAKK